MSPKGDLRLDGLKVLVVDDDGDSLQFLVFLFETYGAEVAAASSASDAFQAVLEWRPDILVSDVSMPDEDGYTLIRRIRALTAQQGGQVPAIALTANAKESDRLQAIAAGFGQHIAKPADLDELLQAVLEMAASKICVRFYREWRIFQIRGAASQAYNPCDTRVYYFCSLSTYQVSLSNSWRKSFIQLPRMRHVRKTWDIRHEFESCAM
ncbi:response regulator, partial [Leptolyngbya sp. FACHB-671]|uniref:response regulator n=1 Tax=Leptolyngbya sp. FACHB-671 TaxID=2692812 RepID=UPI001682EB21